MPPIYYRDKCGDCPITASGEKTHKRSRPPAGGWFRRHPCRLGFVARGYVEIGPGGPNAAQGRGQTRGRAKEPPAHRFAHPAPLFHISTGAIVSLKKKPNSQSLRARSPTSCWTAFWAVPDRFNIHIRTASKKIFPDRRLRLTLLSYLIIFLSNMITIRKAHRE